MTTLLRIKKLPNWIDGQLSRVHDDDAAYDIMAASDFLIRRASSLPCNLEEVKFEDGTTFNRRVLPQQFIPTGFAIQPDSYGYCLILLRSSIGYKYGFQLANGSGVVDAGFKNQIYVCVINHLDYDIPIKKGERIAQLIWTKLDLTNLAFVEEFSETTRGMGGFGSTGQ